MKRRLYIHIGAPRTATTTVQDFLCTNKDVLAQKGYWLVNGQGRHLRLMEQLSYEEITAAQAAALIDRQIAQCPHDIHSVILSDEDICRNIYLDFLQPFQDHFDVRLIYTLRRQDLWLESWYLQNIKWQWDRRFRRLTFAQFMEMSVQFHWIDYDQGLVKMENLFGQDHISIGLYEKHAQSGTPIENFLGHLGIERTEEFLTPNKKVNVSFTPEMSEFARRLQLGTANETYRNSLIHILGQVDQELRDKLRDRGHQGSDLLFTHAERRAILACHAPGNERVAQRYFGREQLFLDPVPDENAPLAKLELPENSEELMGQFIIPFVQKLIKTYGKR